MLLLDTHAFIWLASDQSKLPPKTRSVISAHAGALLLSGISGLEIALAAKRGRLELPMAPAEFITRALAQHGIREIPVSATIGCAAAQLPDIHNDPFDRIIVATAHHYQAKLLSKDRNLKRYPEVKVLWNSGM